MDSGYSLVNPLDTFYPLRNLVDPVYSSSRDHFLYQVLQKAPKDVIDLSVIDFKREDYVPPPPPRAFKDYYGDEQPVMIELLDTAGQDEFQALMDMYLVITHSISLPFFLYVLIDAIGISAKWTWIHVGVQHHQPRFILESC
jgi:hypothetical protein